MEIKNMEQAQEVRELIGEQNFQATERALADGARVWVFKTPDEVDACSDLSAEEKKECKTRFAETGGTYAGWVRVPERNLFPAILPVSGDYDTHGNYHGRGSGSSSEPWSH